MHCLQFELYFEFVLNMYVLFVVETVNEICFLANSYFYCNYLNFFFPYV